jgi:hypothetical protein
MDRSFQLVLDCLDAEHAPFEPWNARRFSPEAHRGAHGPTID